MAVKTIDERVKGFRELRDRLKALPDRLQKKVLSKAVRAGAVVVQGKAKELSPVRPGGGALRRNIVVRPSRQDKKTADSEFIVGVVHGKPPPVTDGKVTVKNKWGKIVTRRATRREKRGEDPYYFRFQELGFHAVGRRKGGSGRLIPGRRFLTNSIIQAKDTAINAMREKLAAGIDAGEATK